jgi:acetolactate synthase-1/2/3 large subunit
LKRTGAQIFVESLKAEGIDTIFCYPGGATLNITDALTDISQINQVVVRHEQAAVHAADGYARASGRVGVALVTSGPGATNTVTGIATAYMDSIPLVVFSCQVNTMLIGNDAFQEADIVGITRPCTKHSYLVRDVKDLARIIKEAFHIALGKTGPVLVDIPKDVSSAVGDFKYPEKAVIRSYQPTYVGHTGQIKKAMRLILHSKRPVLYTGGGVILSNASQELTRFAEALSIPVTNTLMGLGGIPGNHPLFLGMLGMHGTYTANMAITESDLIIAMGARFDDRATGKTDEFAPHARIIHIDIDPTSISKNIKVDIPIVGDTRNVLTQMLKIVEEEREVYRQYHRNISDWIDKIGKWKKDYPLTYQKNNTLKPQYVIERVFELTKGKAIITTEVGQNQMWAAQFFRFLKPRTASHRVASARWATGSPRP